MSRGRGHKRARQLPAPKPDRTPRTVPLPERARSVQLSLDRAGMGLVVINGLDVSHLTRRVELVAEVGHATEIRLEMIAADVFANVQGLVKSSPLKTRLKR